MRLLKVVVATCTFLQLQLLKLEVELTMTHLPNRAIKLAIQVHDAAILALQMIL
jgi:hypothetical protein